MFVQTLLEGGAREASRYGMTGQQPDGVSRDDMILQIVGENSFGIIDMDELEMETRVYDSFSGLASPSLSPTRRATMPTTRASCSPIATATAPGTTTWVPPASAGRAMSWSTG